MLAQMKTYRIAFGVIQRQGESANIYIYVETTPLHSILHEASHYIRIQAHQRSLTQVDAKGTAMEENSTCYLQLVLSDLLRAIVDRSIWKIWIIGL